MNKILISMSLLIILIFSIGLVSADENFNDTIVEYNTNAPNLSYPSNTDNTPLEKTGGVVRHVMEALLKIFKKQLT